MGRLAEADMSAAEYDFRLLAPRERYKLLIGAIVPRPVALVTTVSSAGRVNAAPFSFFSADPPILALGVENHPDMRFKDAAANIRETEVFTVNIVSPAIAEAMHVCAGKFPPEVDELVEAGLTARPGVAVAAPWIAEAPAAFECRRHPTLSLGRSHEIILGEVLHAHFAQGAVDDRLHVDPAAIDAIARLGGDTCCTIRDRFDMPTPSYQDWPRARRTG
jgi:flavin reductase (DIM6/NTAB) family NADH-FMN oxidoreductase RutF